MGSHNQFLYFSRIFSMLFISSEYSPIMLVNIFVYSNKSSNNPNTNKKTRTKQQNSSNSVRNKHRHGNKIKITLTFWHQIIYPAMLYNKKSTPQTAVQQTPGSNLRC